MSPFCADSSYDILHIKSSKIIIHFIFGVVQICFTTDLQLLFNLNLKLLQIRVPTRKKNSCPGEKREIWDGDRERENVTETAARRFTSSAGGQREANLES